VTNTGPGIPLDQRDRIFEQFHQVDSSMTKAKGGTGLGLAIAKQWRIPEGCSVTEPISSQRNAARYGGLFSINYAIEPLRKRGAF